MSRSLQIALNMMDETIYNLIHDADHLIMYHELTPIEIERIRDIRLWLYYSELALEDLIE